MSNIFGNDWAMPVRASRWGHHGPTVFVGIIAAMAAMAILPVSWPTGAKPLISIGFIAVMLKNYREMKRHDRGLCEQCMSEFPLNPAQDAERHQRRLETVHLMAEKKVAAYYLAAILVACLLPIFAPPSLRTPAMALWLASLVSLVYIVQSGQVHRKLQPWCPQCGHQGGQDHVDTPEPIPMGGLSR